ncbi:hypothetical protein [Plasmodium yoelii yoelii]|uniref:Uncharacterized protein n=1 Tax=Plasmodium yoelii yoelii TaxID=73239 RepID=Q7R8X9_PLAYO|nr:hypothetical protein [Plasmodium yoelii yoelii]
MLLLKLCGPFNVNGRTSFLVAHLNISLGLTIRKWKYI